MISKKNTARIFLLLWILTFYGTSSAQLNPQKYGELIHRDSLKIHVDLLASDEFEGRETGKPGQKKAAEYISNRFAMFGIPPVNKGSYYQEFPLKISQTGGVTITSGGMKFKNMEDYYFFQGFGDTSIFNSKIWVYGFGIKEEKYNDYTDPASVKGKIIMLLPGEPMKKGKSLVSDSEKVSVWTTEWRRKLSTARSLEPAAIFIVTSHFEKNRELYRHMIESPRMTLADDEKKNAGIPYFYINETMANKMLRPTGTSVQKLVKKATKKGGMEPLSVSQQVSINIKRNIEQIKSENVLGYIEGKDLKDELVVITAHYDHLGVHGKEIYYGADDNASGTAALIELARVMNQAKKEGNGPRRSILIMPVSAEEKGLLGSLYYTKNPVFPLSNTVANLNIDMIGRVDEKHTGNADYIYLIGADKLSRELHEVSEKANATYTKLELDYTYNHPDDPNRYYYRSDHYNFAKNNIPVIFYFNGVHPDYHEPTDTADKIDTTKMEKIARLVFYTAWDLANRDQRIKLDKAEKP